MIRFDRKVLRQIKEEKSLLKKSEMLAKTAHANQTDKAGREYVSHLQSVVCGVENDEQIQSAAWLHDVLEDTIIEKEDLLDMGFPKVIVEAVAALTRMDGESYMQYIVRLSGNDIAREVKMSDIRNNMNLERIGKSVKNKDLLRCEKYIKAYRFLLDY